MEFRQLRASMQHNAEEKPSIYMAFCLIESLFKDIQLESGSDKFCQAPLGDETLSIKMTWLCRQLNQTYDTKYEEMARGRQNLEKQLAALHEKNKELESLTHISEQLHDAQSKLESLDTRLQELQAEEQERQELETEIARVEQKIRELENVTLEDARNRLTLLQEKYDARKAEEDRLTQTHSALESEIRKLNEAIEQMKAALETVRQQKNNTQQELHTAQEQAATLCDTLKNLEAQAAEAHGKISEYEALKQRQAEFIGTLQAEIASLGKQIDTCRIQKIRPMEVERQGQNHELNQLAEASQQLQQEITALAGKLTDAQAAYQKLDMLRQQKKQELMSVTEQIRRLNDEISEHTEQIAQLNQTIPALTDRRTAQKDYMQQLQEKCSALKNEINAFYAINLKPLEEQLRQKEESLGHFDEEKLHLQTQIDEKAADIQNAILEIGRLDDRLREKQTEIDQKAGKCARKKDEVRQKEREKENTRKAYDELVTRLGALQGDIELMKSKRIPEVNTMHQNASDQLDGLKNELQTTQAEIDALETRIAELNSSLPEHEKERDQLKETYEVLTQRYGQADQEIVDLKEKLNELRSHTDEEEYAQYKRDLNADIERLEKIRQDSGRLEREYTEKHASLKERYHELDTLKGDIANVRQQSETMKQEIMKKQEELRRLQSEYSELAAQKLTVEWSRQEKRLKVLKSATGDLNQSMAAIHKAIGRTEAYYAEYAVMEKMESTLKNLREYTRHISESLNRCAQQACKELEETE